jgi:hypothetical protein
MKINPQIKNTSKSNYWINSNSGDYIHQYPDGTYILNLVSRKDSNGNYLPYERIQLTTSQVNTIKGFVPIKEKRLFSRTAGVDKRDKWAPTLSDGTKGVSERVKVPQVDDIRDFRLKELGL